MWRSRVVIWELWRFSGILKNIDECSLFVIEKWEHSEFKERKSKKKKRAEEFKLAFIVVAKHNV